MPAGPPPRFRLWVIFANQNNCYVAWSGQHAARAGFDRPEAAGWPLALDPGQGRPTSPFPGADHATRFRPARNPAARQPLPAHMPGATPRPGGAARLNDIRLNW